MCPKNNPYTHFPPSLLAQDLVQAHKLHLVIISILSSLIQNTTFSLLVGGDFLMLTFLKEDNQLYGFV